jgi:hypothetical protein
MRVQRFPDAVALLTIVQGCACLRQRAPVFEAAMEPIRDLLIKSGADASSPELLRERIT